MNYVELISNYVQPTNCLRQFIQKKKNPKSYVMNHIESKWKIVKSKNLSFVTFCCYQGKSDP